MKTKPILHVVDLVTTNKDKKFEPAGRMAEDIIAIRDEIGACLPQDLNAKGYTPAEVDELWHIANSLADVEIGLRQEQPLKHLIRRR